MNIDDGSAADGGPDATVRLVSYCARHCTPHPELSGDNSSRVSVATAAQLPSRVLMSNGDQRQKLSSVAASSCYTPHLDD
jgi:hypothetical protein